MANVILLSASGLEGEKKTRFQPLLHSYYHGHHCDLEIQCQGSQGGILCHRWILSQVSSSIKSYLASSGFQQESILILPADCSLEQVRCFLDTVYQGLASQEDITFDPSLGTLAQALGLQLQGQGKKEEEDYDEEEEDQVEMEEEKVEEEEQEEEEEDQQMEDPLSVPSDEPWEGEDFFNDVQFDSEDETKVEKEWAAKNKQEDSKLDPNVVKNLDHLRSQAKQIILNPESEAIQDVPVLGFTKKASPHYFQAICAISLSPKAKVLAKPLCWTLPDESEYLSQFQTSLEYFQARCGFSRFQMVLQRQVRTKKEMAYYSKTVRNSFVIKYLKQTQEVNQQLLTEEEKWIKDHEFAPLVIEKSISLPRRVDLIFTSELSKEACDNIVLLSWSGNGLSLIHI